MMKIILGTILAAVIGFGFLGKSNLKNIFRKKNHIYSKPENLSNMGNLHTFTVKSLDGKDLSLSAYKGKKVVLLNVASKCGYTPQYADWQKFHEKYGKDIVVLGFPANDFMKQEPGNSSEIAEFCQKNYGVTFQMCEKVEVTGKSQHPLYSWLSNKSLNGWNDKAPTWNFCKYVVDENGNLTHFFESNILPNNKEFTKALGI
jgi:glutathione peroxidase